MEEIRYELMRPGQIIAARDKAPVAYLPLGPLEWHGPHLPFGVDMLHAHAMALEAAGQTGGVVLPPLPLGTETYITPERLRDRGFKGDERIIGMDFPGFPLPSLYIEECALGVVINEMVRLLKRQRFRVIVLVNGHGGPNHRALLSRIAIEQSEPENVAIFLTGALLDTHPRGHASLRETSYMLNMHPETVDLDTLPPWPTPIRTYEVGVLDHPTCAGEPAPDFSICPDQDPRRATAEQGLENVVREGKSIAGKVQAALATLLGYPSRPNASTTGLRAGTVARPLVKKARTDHPAEGIRYELLRPQQIIAARTRLPVAYIPIGPLEWHGPHLPYGTDMLHAYAMALEAARETGGVVLPPLPLGTETYTDPERLRYQGFKGHERVMGIDFPGFPLTSLYIEESAFGVIVREVVRGLKRQAFRVIGLVNGHGAPNQRTTLERLAVEESEPGKVAVFLTGFRFVTRYRGHAELGETSFTLAYHPESVDLTALPPLPRPLRNLDFAVLDGPTCAGQPTADFTVRGEQDPRHAEAARGKDDVAYEAHQIALKARELLPTAAGG